MLYDLLYHENVGGGRYLFGALYRSRVLSNIFRIYSKMMPSLYLVHRLQLVKDMAQHRN
jgi:hypothetical protein